MNLNRMSFGPTSVPRLRIKASQKESLLEKHFHGRVIKDSDVQFAGVVQGRRRFAMEPENYTRESGLELRYRF